MFLALAYQTSYLLGVGVTATDLDIADGTRLVAETEDRPKTALTPATKDRPSRLTDRLKTEASQRVVPMFPAVEVALQELLAVELAAGGWSRQRPRVHHPNGRP